MRNILLYVAIAIMVSLILYGIIDTRFKTIEGAVGDIVEDASGSEPTPPPIGYVPNTFNTPTQVVTTTMPVTEYKEEPSLSSNPLYLSTLNAANITYLKGKLDELISIRKELSETKTTVSNNTVLLNIIDSKIRDITTRLDANKL